MVLNLGRELIVLEISVNNFTIFAEQSNMSETGITNITA